MSWFFLDTHERGTARLGWLGPQGSRLFRHAGVMGGLVGLIARRIPRQDLMQADGICVVSGPGSFSSIRSGVLIANLMSRVLKKPLVGVVADDAKNVDQLGRDLHNGKYSVQRYVAPLYDQEPNITVSPRI